MTLTGMDPSAQPTREPLTDAEWIRIFAVFVDPAGGSSLTNLPAVAGKYFLERDRLRFEPQFPLRRGVRYRAVFHPSRLSGSSGSDSSSGVSPLKPGEPIIREFLLPAAKTNPTATVKKIYPTTGLLPENQLKFYLYFSDPMSRGQAYEHIHLLDENGKEIEMPFLEIDEELWDPSGVRLTIFFDPGRVKRELRPREEEGPPLVEGKTYTLVIEKKWKDAAGNALVRSFRKKFRVGPADYKPPVPASWKLSSPFAGTREPLIVRFPEPLDHALLHRLLWVTGPGARRLEGQVAVSEKEQKWSFVPASQWTEGEHHLVARTTLEDLAGNNIGRPFEVDIFERVEQQLPFETATVPFQVRSMRKGR